MSTSLEICQRATVLIGANQPEAFDDGSLEGETCESVYEDLLVSMLSNRPWTFASKQVQLTEAAEESELGFNRVFIIPAESIKVFHARSSKGSRVQVDYEILDGRLHTNVTRVFLKYAFKVNETFLSGDFVMALKYGVAAEINLPITGNVSRTDFFQGKFSALVKIAAFTDGRSTPNKAVSSYRLLSARRSGGRR